MKIERNQHPFGRINNIHFGLCQLADGLIRVCSLGFLHSTFTLDQTREASLKHLRLLKEKQK